MSTPRRLYHDKRNRRLSLSDDDGQGMKDGDGESGDEGMYQTEGTDGNRTNTLDLVDGYYNDDGAVPSSSPSSLHLVATPPFTGGRKRLTTQPMTANELSQARQLSPTRQNMNDMNDLNDLNDTGEPEDDATRVPGSGEKKHRRVQTTEGLRSPLKQRDRDAMSIDSSHLSVISDLSEQSSVVSSEDRDSGSLLGQAMQQEAQPVATGTTTGTTTDTATTTYTTGSTIDTTTYTTGTTIATTTATTTDATTAPPPPASNKRTSVESSSSTSSFSSSVTTVVDDSQTLFTCVWGSGRLPGLPDGERTPATMVSLDYDTFRGKRIVQVACGMGSRQAMYLTAGGDVYRSHNTFGDNDEGIHDASTERSTYATALSNSPMSKLIETGRRINGGGGGGGGDGGAKGGPGGPGQGGTEGNTEGNTGNNTGDREERIKVREPTLVQDFAWERALQKLTVVSVACGAHHCCALADGGQIFTWGRASGGRLGLAKHYKDTHDRTEVKTPKLVLPLLGTRIVDVQCGSSHTIAREASAVEDLGDGRVRCVGGRLFSWGKGTCVATGLVKRNGGD